MINRSGFKYHGFFQVHSDIIVSVFKLFLSVHRYETLLLHTNVKSRKAILRHSTATAIKHLTCDYIKPGYNTESFPKTFIIESIVKTNRYALTNRANGSEYMAQTIVNFPSCAISASALRT